MVKKSPPAGTYILTGEIYNHHEGAGIFTTYEKDDEVELNAAQAARLLSGPIASFVKKPDASDQSDQSSSEKPQLREMQK